MLWLWLVANQVSRDKVSNLDNSNNNNFTLYKYTSARDAPASRHQFGKTDFTNPHYEWTFQILRVNVHDGSFSLLL